MNRLDRRLAALEARRAEKLPRLIVTFRPTTDSPDDATPSTPNAVPWRVESHGREWAQETNESEPDFIERIKSDLRASGVRAPGVVVLDAIDEYL